MIDLRLYLLQRITALIMVPFVFVHLGVMIYAIQGGVSAAEILGRTQGSLSWGLFYGTFVVAAGVHGAIGLRAIAHEWLGLRWGLGALTFCLGFGLIATGLRAVIAVTGGGA